MLQKAYSCNKWKCGICKEVIRESVCRCPRCGELKSRGWKCRCGASNFPNRRTCFKCNTAKLAVRRYDYAVAGAVGSLWNVQICDHGSPIRLSSEYERCHIMISGKRCGGWNVIGDICTMTNDQVSQNNGRNRTFLLHGRNSLHPIRDVPLADTHIGV